MKIITELDIKKKVEELAEQLSSYFIKKKIYKLQCIFILDGSFIFAADLLRSLSKFYSFTTYITSFKIKTYEGVKKGSFNTFKDDDVDHLNLQCKDVLIIEDIIDTGKSMSDFNEILNETYELDSITYCFLLNKKDITNSIKEQFFKGNETFVGFNIPNEFVIGYGLDHNDRYRDLPYIGKL